MEPYSDVPERNTEIELLTKIKKANPQFSGFAFYFLSELIMV